MSVVWFGGRKEAILAAAGDFEVVGEAEDGLKEP